MLLLLVNHESSKVRVKAITHLLAHLKTALSQQHEEMGIIMKIRKCLLNRIYDTSETVRESALLAITLLPVPLSDILPQLCLSNQQLFSHTLNNLSHCQYAPADCLSVLAMLSHYVMHTAKNNKNKHMKQQVKQVMSQKGISIRDLLLS